MILYLFFQPIVNLGRKLRVTIDINGMDIEADDGVYGLAVNGKTRLLAKSHLL